ncbi:uncharacterized protein LOC114936271 [Nylanderia fulva]|uniref:uncharacterized protein LOC114936271 n=1 Tax=Nylanderia fulva TaxID=613905 RepID=UPI0010FB97FC|nr:uncharacterized protein LOC114936271 [Nylanderia fulva]
MKAALLGGILFCITLPLISGLDLNELIQVAQCRSMCLRNFGIFDKCEDIKIIGTRTSCRRCWDICESFGSFQNKERVKKCKLHFQILINDWAWNVVCKFFLTRETEEEKYELIKLPAPEEDNIIRMNKNDVAIKLNKNQQGTWIINNLFTTNHELEMRPGDWIIITNDKGTIKQYSWEKWQPTLESGTQNGSLFEINISWTDWQAQLKKQREKVDLFNKDKVSLELRNRTKAQNKTFVVTWQEKTGNGIMGNQVADSESAQISVPPGKYLVRIASNDGPGSYSILIDTNDIIKCRFPVWPIILLIGFSVITVISVVVIALKLKDKIQMIRLNRKKMKTNKNNNVPPISFTQSTLSFGTSSSKNNYYSAIYSSVDELINTKNPEEVLKQNSNSDTSSSMHETIKSRS